MSQSSSLRLNPSESPSLRIVESPAIVPEGALPPLGVVPARMHGYAIRPERQGDPLDSFVSEELPTPEPGFGEVLVQVMAAGVNYNGVWAGRGKPVSVFDMHGQPFHVPGSDASGVVWKVGPGVRDWKVGDEVIMHCNRTCGQCAACNGGEPMMCRSQKIWGYETPDGSFAQYTIAQAQQLLPKPAHLTWEEASSYALVAFTAWRMLMNRAELRPGDDVLVWGGAGGLGVFALQICKLVGARAVAVVSSAERAELALKLGAEATLDRRDFPNLAYAPDETPAQTKARLADTKAFGKRLWEIFGERKGPDVVFEHVGQQTFPASVFLANRGGRIVICGATTGFELNFDVRHLWMHQKSILGSHFANAGECAAANKMFVQGKLTPVLTETFSYGQIPLAHDMMARNRLHGTATCLVGAPRTGLRNLAETLAATGP
jgi:crotonyl-CoA carboxylase/reductase